MKIGFQGFRGFGKDNELIEVSDLTIFTGKNSSGKSTYLKLLKLIANSLKGVKNFNDLMQLRIKPSTKQSNNISNFIDSSQLKFIVEFIPYYFTENHQIHIKFKIEEFELIVDEIEIYNEINLKPIFTIDNRRITIDCFRLQKLYDYFTRRSNICEDYLYERDQKLKESKASNKRYFEKLKLSEEEKENLEIWSKKHLLVTDWAYNIFNKVNPVNEDSYFYTKSVEYYGFFNRLSEVNKSINYDASSVLNFLENDENTKEDFEEYLAISEYKNNIAKFKKKLNEFQKTLFSNYIVDNKSFVCEPAIYGFQMSKFVNIFNGNDDLTDYMYWLDTLLGILCDNQTENCLVQGTLAIFEMSIIELLNHISKLKFHTSIKYEIEDSINVFKNEDPHSEFLKNYLLLNSEQKGATLKNIKKLLNNLGIVENIQIEVINNTGFIYLYKNKHKYLISEEGSGALKLISLILFLEIINIKRIKDQDILPNLRDSNWLKTYDKKIIIIEEPESNLHPDLQSKLADVLVNYIEQVHFVIETHSEYLIRKLQYLVSIRKIQPSKINLYYFEKRFKNRRTINDFYKIKIESDGSLDRNFGSGFFDEANNSAIRLFLINNSQKN
jgi:energy-coupling factor transporter ATP-binding protein EcfA2